MTAVPHVSVIIPTYNRAAYLHRALTSVRAQTCGDWEAIVVDDGSTDDTVTSVAGLADGRIRIVGSPHTGSPARARNIGLRHVRGAYVAFLDSDDLWRPTKLERQLRALDAAPDARWSYTGYELIDEDEQPIAHRLVGPSWSPESGWILKKLLTEQASVAIQTVVLERSLLGKTGGFDEELQVREDFDLVLRLAAGAAAVAVPEALVGIRDHPSRTTKGRSAHHVYAARAFGKMVGVASDPSVQRLAHRQYVLHMTLAAREYARGGASRKAFRVLFRLLPAGAGAAQWWVSLGKCLAYPILRRSWPRGLG